MLTNIIFHPRWRNVGSCWRPCRAGPDAWRCWGFNGPRWSQALCRHLVEPQGIACFKRMPWLSRSISNQRKKSRHANPFATNLITHAPHFVTMKSWMIIIIGLLEVTQCYVCVCVDISGPGTGGIRAATFTDAPQPLSGLFEGCTKKNKKRSLRRRRERFDFERPAEEVMKMKSEDGFRSPAHKLLRVRLF